MHNPIWIDCVGGGNMVVSIESANFVDLQIKQVYSTCNNIVRLTSIVSVFIA